MPIPRAYHSFPELAERWKASELDLRRLLLEGILRPSVWIDEQLQTVAWLQRDGQYVPIPATVNGNPVTAPLKGYYTLEGANVTAAFECEYSFVSDATRPDQDAAQTHWWRLGRPLVVADVLVSAVVMDAEVRRVDKVLSLVDEAKDDERTRATAEKVMYGWAVSSFGFDPTKGRSEVPTQIIETLASVGVTVSPNTLRSLIRKGYERVGPVEPRTRELTAIAPAQTQ